MVSMVRTLLSSPWLALGFRLYLGTLFIYASMYKISYAGEFASTIANYQLVPYWAVNPTAVVLPWIEMVSGALLVVGVRPKASIIVIGAMLGVFTVAIAIMLMKGTTMGCGCFHSLEEPMSWKTLVRDLIWIGMAVHVYLFDTKFHLEKKFLGVLKEASHAPNA